jgi:hypothetical protein
LELQGIDPPEKKAAQGTQGQKACARRPGLRGTSNWLRGTACALCGLLPVACLLLLIDY